MGRKWPSRGDPDRVKPQVRTGAPPGTRTPNPRIKSPLLCSRLPRYYLRLYAHTSEDMSLPCRTSYRVTTATASPYRRVRASTERATRLLDLGHSRKSGSRGP